MSEVRITEAQLRQIDEADEYSLRHLSSEVSLLVDSYRVVVKERDHLQANQDNNLCRYPVIHDGDVELLVAEVSGVSQTELARRHGCTAPNINRKIRRIRQRIGWRRGMGEQEIRARAQQHKDMAEASAGGANAALLVIERDQLRTEVEELISGMTRIMQATRLGDPAFAIACEVIGEMGTAKAVNHG